MEERKTAVYVKVQPAIETIEAIGAIKKPTHKTLGSGNQPLCREDCCEIEGAGSCGAKRVLLL